MLANTSKFMGSGGEFAPRPLGRIGNIAARYFEEAEIEGPATDTASSSSGESASGDKWRTSLFAVIVFLL
jgi:hypothetical protein